MWDEGIKAYIQNMWNILDFVTNSFYVATFTLKLVAYLNVSKLSSYAKLVTLCCLFVFTGLIWAEVKQLWDEGLKAYIQDMWNILDFTTNSFYVATFTLKFVAYMKVSEISYTTPPYDS